MGTDESSTKKARRGGAKKSKSVRITGRRRRPDGKLKIGNQWNAISIIALSQHSPLKALAELVENSIDAGARHISVTRGREAGQAYLRVVDDGRGVPMNDDGTPNFKFVATHICDSLKRKLKDGGDTTVQGEFGIGLLGFWTLGQTMVMTCPDKEGNLWDLTMEKGDAGYHIDKRKVLVSTSGTEITIKKLLNGPAQLNGEKINKYLADELGERIRETGVEINIIDKSSRYEEKVIPREFTGQPVIIPAEISGDFPAGLAVDIYFRSHPKNRKVSLYKSGTRILEDITQVEGFDVAPWNSGFFQGKIDFEELNLSPASRLGIIQDEAVVRLLEALTGTSGFLQSFLIQKQDEATENSTFELSRIIRTAMRESLMALTAEGITWNFSGNSAESKKAQVLGDSGDDGPVEDNGQRMFFEIAGALHSALITPSSAVVQCYSELELRIIGRDRQRRVIENPKHIHWEITEGPLSIISDKGEKLLVEASGNPGLARIRGTITHGEAQKAAEALITVTESVPHTELSDNEILHDHNQKIDIPEFTLEEKPGELWRSRFSRSAYLIYINSGHRDYIYASGNRQTLARYISRLYAKELVLLHNSGRSTSESLEQLIQIELYMDANLKVR